jgi:phosphorylase kinase alpha/beta subunit
MNLDEMYISLERHYDSINKIILSRQDPITGLLPASTAINAHGDYTDAWVRDNVYSIMSVWGLALAYRKYNPDHCRSYSLSQSVVKLMRGLLVAMMRQSDRVEKFKNTLNQGDALHAKYGTSTGLAVVGDHEWGHLQLDATSLFLLMMAQMIASGLRLIYTLDEVNFVQNLVHYISRTYCTPDYGIWERGNKINSGGTEINCSSVGMTKAALEAMSGFNLYGNVASQEALIHVVPSDIARSRLTLQGLLPRESNSKETDAALLSIIGYPAYAVEDELLVNKTLSKIIKKLSGRYGCKRFLLDGHQSSIEDHSRLHYEPSELQTFQHIESEWPLFFTYLLLDAHMREDSEAITHWREKLEPLFIKREGVKLLPELYIVPKELIDAEKENPSSQERVANENLPLVWAQSLFMLSDMIQDGLLRPSDIDPLRRRERIGQKRTTHPLVCILAQNESVKQQLLNLGIMSETIEELKPIQIMHASMLSLAHTQLGKNDKLGLSGRPLLAARTITTAKLHILSHEEILFLPYYFNPRGFYFSYDNTLLVERFRSSLKFLTTHWDQPGQPILPFLVREDMLQEGRNKEVLRLLHDFQNGSCNSMTIKLGPLRQLLSTASVERIDDIHGLNLNDLHIEVQEADTLYESAALALDWINVRLMGAALGKYDDRLEDALLDIIIHQKRLAVGRAYSENATLSKPSENSAIVKVINESCGNNRAEGILTQEVIMHLGHLIRSEPQLFKDMITLRTWYFVQLLVGRIAREEDLPIGDAYERLLSLAPHDIFNRIRSILKAFTHETSELIHQENLHNSGISLLHAQTIGSSKNENSTIEDWNEWRRHEGMLSRLSPHFYKDVWHMLHQCNALVIGDKYNIQSRLGTEHTLASTAGEQSFSRGVEDLLQSIEAPEYRQLNIEAIESLTKLFKENPDLRIDDDIILDVLIGYAVRMLWESKNGSANYDEARREAWEEFYHASLEVTHEQFVHAFIYLSSPK